MKDRIGWILVFAVCTLAPAAVAQVHPLLLDSPVIAGVAADGADASEIAPLESTLPAPQPNHSPRNTGSAHTER